MLVSTLMLILSTPIGASASSATTDVGFPSLYHFDAMSRGIEPLDKSTFVQSYAEYYQLRQDMRAHATTVTVIDDVPGPYRHLEESEAQMEFTQECVTALMSSPNTDDRLISQVEFADFLNGLTDDDAKDLMFHNLFWTVSLFDFILWCLRSPNLICTIAIRPVHSFVAPLAHVVTHPGDTTHCTDPSQVCLGYLHQPRSDA